MSKKTKKCFAKIFSEKNTQKKTVKKKMLKQKNFRKKKLYFEGRV